MRNLLQHFDGSDADRLERSIGTVSCHGVELVDDGLGLVIRDFAENGVMAVEPFGWHGGDEELGAVGAVDLAVHAAAQAGVCHGQQVRAIEGQAWNDFIIEVVARAASAGAQRAATLDHEILDDAVEGQTIVERFVARLTGERVGPFLLASGEAQEVGHGFRGLVIEQVDLDVAFSDGS